MTRRIRTRPIFGTLAISATALVTNAGADTILVDDDGGPGVDYTDIAPAVAAATPGDLVLVLPGSYSGFTVDKEVTVLGTVAEGVGVSGTIHLDGAQGAGPMVLSTFHCNRLDVRNAESVVVVDAVSGSHAEIERCDDVRLHDCQFGSGDLGSTGLVTRFSRVEIVESELTGEGGCDCADLDPGSAIYADSSRVHFALSSAIGHHGPNSMECWFLNYYDCDADLDHGDGADGIHAFDSYLHVSGIAGNEIAGGDAGGWGDSTDGRCGYALHLFDSSCRLSGVSVSDGWGYYYWDCDSGDPCLTPVPDDPTLELEGIAVPGSTIQFRLHAPAGAAARLVFGREAVVIPVPDRAEDRLTSVERVVALGRVPPTGVLALDLPLPAQFPQGLTFYAQAEVVLTAGGDPLLTHSVPIVVH